MIRYDGADLDCCCPDCGARYSGKQSSGGHCRGGKYLGCCQSFASQTIAGKHRTGPYDPPGARRCLTPDEMREKGWGIGGDGAWRLPPAADPHWKKEPAS